MSANTWRARGSAHEISRHENRRERSWLVQVHARPPEWGLDLPPLAPIRSPSMEDVFGGLLATWKDETALSSSLTEILLNPAYQAIIGLGLEAVPLLLRELAREPTHLGWALASITRENPVTEEMAGDVVAQAEAWLAWGRLRGYR